MAQLFAPRESFHSRNHDRGEPNVSFASGQRPLAALGMRHEPSNAVRIGAGGGHGEYGEQPRYLRRW
jgi:hypothetical protein